MIHEIQDFAIVLLAMDGTILSWNKGVEKIKGYKEVEIIGKNFRIFYLPLDRQEGLPENLLELAKLEGRASHIGRRLHKDGSTYWASSVFTALHNDADEVVGFTKLTRQILNGDKDE